jgi:hypothetical protein
MQWAPHALLVVAVLTNLVLALLFAKQRRTTRLLVEARKVEAMWAARRERFRARS